MSKSESNFIEITLRHGCSVNLLHIFGAPFPKNSSRWLLLTKSEGVFNYMNGTVIFLIQKRKVTGEKITRMIKLIQN